MLKAIAKTKSKEKLLHQNVRIRATSIAFAITMKNQSRKETKK